MIAKPNLPEFPNQQYLQDKLYQEEDQQPDVNQSLRFVLEVEGNRPQPFHLFKGV